MTELKLYPFQREAVDRALELDEGLHVVYDLGTGKSVIGIATMLEMKSRGMVDHVLLVCERNKLGEWEEDVARFTDLSALRYHGSNRKRKLEKEGLPDVLITTYETAKADLVVFEKAGRGKSTRDNLLLEKMLGRNWLVVYDEAARLSNRQSGIYKAHFHAVKRLRSQGNVRVLGLTGTPIERDWENAFNQLRLVAPSSMPTITSFEENFVSFRDPFGRAQYRYSRMPEFVDMASRVMIRKRKTDSDVRNQFPRMVEEARYVDLHPDHKKLYDAVREAARDEEGGMVPGAYTIMRQLAGHPAAVLHSQESSELAQTLVEAIGEGVLMNLPSAKSQALREHLRAVVKDQGAKAVVFTFFGQSVLRELRVELESEGFTVFSYHGGLTPAEAERTVKDFRSHPEPCVFLSSDSGAQGINLPEATYVVEYESALTYAKRAQRINRINRLTSGSESVHCLTLVARDTVEEDIVTNMLTRNAMLDQLNGDSGEGHVSATDRMRIFYGSR